MASDLLQCPHCGTDREHFHTELFPEEECEYIMCSVCDNLVSSVTKFDDTFLNNAECKESFSERDEDASNDQNENVIDISDVDCVVDPVEDGRSTYSRSVSLPLSSNNHRMLRNSCSAFNFEDQWNVQVDDRHSATLDNGELSGDCLKQTRELYCDKFSRGCPGCCSWLLPVEGLRNIFHCSECMSLHGVDDTMNYYDLLQKGDYVVEACDACGNTNPDLFLVEAGSMPDSINLRCMKCSGMTRESQNESAGNLEIAGEEDESVFDRCIKEWIYYECKCNNSDSELQKISIDSSSSAVFVKCWVCEREDMITLDFKPKVCTCSTGDSVDVRFDEFGYASQLVCLKCRAEMDCGPSGVGDTAAAGDGTSTGRTRISCVSEIQVGDHIALHQMLGYWHHAIVTGVNGAQVRVVHYNGPSLPNKGKIEEEWIPVDPDSELYRINYKPCDCDHPKAVVERAQSRVGECQYNILTNNCEHFARWCKTGHKRSIQSESFVRSMVQRVYTLLESSVVSGTRWLFTTQQGQAALKYGARIASSSGGAEALKVATQEVAAEVAAPLVVSTTQYAAPALMISREIQMVCRDISEAHRQRRNGHITRQEFIKITLKRTAEGCGSLAGCGIALAIPFTRNPVGCTLGSVIGHGVGAVAGRGLSCLYGRRSS